MPEYDVSVSAKVGVRRTISYPEGDVHQLRVYLSGDSPLVVAAALSRFEQEQGRAVSVGMLLEYLCADYLAGA